ncbi:MAG: hypothetical protein A3A04_02590 [Candidatus Harrisonbacteria bacterium RIFCSPLOWO2_01_FULL_40_28]|uniref:Glycosidase related protein n=1 Tax=Candidatus Harrisonbacteria bacterium RIFCSPLOWO2_01_FULL_40_28 TaxID=1798406 RepID=A0A1G1ZPR4_9BACT|nr:MAG: hypothetical protein A3A04_02590 [Candidatus Harrisonbacteria bacterium RIFCSPLOWO2_01_FULL_40_28]
MKEEALKKIADILRMDHELLTATEKRLSEVTGKQGVFESLAEKNEVLIRDRLSKLGVSREGHVHEVYDALISKIESDDYQIFKSLNNPDFKNPKACQEIGDTAKRVVNPPKGFFLKLDKAREFLLKEPPRQVMAFLQYSSAEEMVAKEDLLELYSALRFIEGSDWLNSVFFKQYETLTPDDFEERDIVVRALSAKWAAESEGFVAKKKHNISHLKELGVVFIIPALLGISGEVLRMFSLLMHYLYEVPFYSSIFKNINKDRATFVQNFTSLLRGDVIRPRVNTNEKSEWLVIQRYLAKDDPHDSRLFFPHINPEAIHWANAENTLVTMTAELDGFSHELTFWGDIGWVGDYFRDENGIDVLVSFNLVDTVMSLVKQKDMIKYLYHHQEALWNQIFIEYFGKDALLEYSRAHLLKGYFEI